MIEISERMAEVPKLLYVVVVDGEDGTRSTSSFRYTRPVLQSCLQLMGCKARHAFKVKINGNVIFILFYCIVFQFQHIELSFR